MAPLGIHRKLSNPPPHVGGEAGACEGSLASIRRLKWRLRATAASLLPKRSLNVTTDDTGHKLEDLHRVAKCGRYLVGQHTTILMGEGGARYVGLETCGSVWLCPVCSAKIAEHRRQEIDRMLNAHVAGTRRRFENDGLWAGEWKTYQAKPGVVYMATMTVPHGRWNTLETLRADVAEAWTRTVRGAPWQRAKARWGIVGVIRSMEVTHGKNGWHPHLHLLVLAEKGGDEQAMRDWIAERWARVLYRLGVCDEDKAWDVYEWGVENHQAERIQTAGEYLAKWGCDAELAKWHVKQGRGGNRSPWQLLAAAGEGEVEARIRWREFAAVMTGTRHITMSHGLRDLYLDGPEMTDMEIAAMEAGIDPKEIVRNTGEVIAGRFRRGVWVRIQRAGVAVDVLEAVERGGWPAALALLREKGLSQRRPDDGG